MHQIVMEITLLIMENHGILFLNFYGNPEDTYETKQEPHHNSIVKGSMLYWSAVVEVQGD